MSQKRVGGIIYFRIAGVLHRAKGNFSYNLGRPKREAVVGSDGVHGFKETPQVGFIEGAITDSQELDKEALVEAKDVDSDLELANGKVIHAHQGWFAADGTGTTEEGEFEVRIESDLVEEIR